MDRLLQNKTKKKNEEGRFGCGWMPSEQDDDIYFLQSKNRNCHQAKHQDTLDKYLIFDNISSKISPKASRISLKRNKSQTFILDQDIQNNISEPKLQPKQQICLPPEQPLQSLQTEDLVTPKQNQNVQKTQMDQINSFVMQKKQDKSYNYRSVISPSPNVCFYPERPFMRHNSSNNDRSNFAAFVPYTPQGNKLMGQQKFRSAKMLEDNNYDDDIFGFANEQNGGSSIMKPTQPNFDKNLIVLTQNDEDYDEEAIEKDSYKSCNKSKFSLFTNIHTAQGTSKASQISEPKPRTMKQLTRMEDVQQIQSVLDDNVEDNKQSIVIDRMTRYSSGGNLLKQLELPATQISAHPLQISFMTQVTTKLS